MYVKVILIITNANQTLYNVRIIFDGKFINFSVSEFMFR